MLPVGRFVKPTELLNVPNGSVPPELLTPCGVGNFTMYHLASRGLKCLLHFAALEGFFPTATGVGRTLHEQELLFDGTSENFWSPGNNYGRYIPNTKWTNYVGAGHTFATPVDQRIWKGITWKRRSSTSSAAVPGTSNHGFWLAIDFATNMPRFLEFVDWLITNAVRFGFSAELQSENWHWRWYVGDSIPVEVLQFEQGDEEEMKPYLVRQYGYQNIFCIFNGPAVSVSGEVYSALLEDYPGIRKVYQDHRPSFLGYCAQAGLNFADINQVLPFDPISNDPGHFE